VYLSKTVWGSSGSHLKLAANVRQQLVLQLNI